jgi:hypothetical protein
MKKVPSWILHGFQFFNGKRVKKKGEVRVK